MAITALRVARSSSWQRQDVAYLIGNRRARGTDHGEAGRPDSGRADGANRATVPDASDPLMLLDRRAVAYALRGFQRQTVAPGLAQQSPSRPVMARDL